jgi:hypothetical protein
LRSRRKKKSGVCEEEEEEGGKKQSECLLLGSCVKKVALFPFFWRFGYAVSLFISVGLLFQRSTIIPLETNL